MTIGVLGKESVSLFASFLRFYGLIASPVSTVGDPAFGGDIGFELSFGFSAITYPIARFIERRYENPRRSRGRIEDAAERAAEEKR